MNVADRAELGLLGTPLVTVVFGHARVPFLGHL